MEDENISTYSKGMVIPIASAIIVAVIIAAVAGFQFLLVGRVIGSGNLVTRYMDFEDFTAVRIGTAFKVEIAQSTSYGVSITADDNVFDYIQVSKTGEKLTIGLAPNHNYYGITLRAKITMPELRELALTGATRCTINRYGSTQGLNVDISGASNLSMEDVSTGDVKIVISGASTVTGGMMVSGNTKLIVSGGSRVELEGTSDVLDIDCYESSWIDLANFAVYNANVVLSDGSQATINLDGRLDCDLSSGSRLYYIGNPTFGDVNNSGGSTISSV